jgi:hypothetical protein
LIELFQFGGDDGESSHKLAQSGFAQTVDMFSLFVVLLSDLVQFGNSC